MCPSPPAQTGIDRTWNQASSVSALLGALLTAPGRGHSICMASGSTRAERFGARSCEGSVSAALPRQRLTNCPPHINFQVHFKAHASDEVF